MTPEWMSKEVAVNCPKNKQVPEQIGRCWGCTGREEERHTAETHLSMRKPKTKISVLFSTDDLPRHWGWVAELSQGTGTQWWERFTQASQLKWFSQEFSKVIQRLRPGLENEVKTGQGGTMPCMHNCWNKIQPENWVFSRYVFFDFSWTYMGIMSGKALTNLLMINISFLII